ncbi:MAG TPA: glycosyltransferase family A protein [Candidatus Binataceae bacterium]|nr:glycosyltransferase family A protein [Candidatus Binataceae bacterium]
MTVHYVAITPARDEEKLLPGLIRSMRAQTLAPARWIVIDDGSTDRTGAILDQAARLNPWIEPHHLSPDHPRQPGGESVIMQFLTADVWRPMDFILRLDADLSFEPDLVELLIAEFGRDPSLGIASPMLAEPQDGQWKDVALRRMHTRGAAKMYSRACFEVVGNLEAGLGWDVIDGAKALRAGFATRSFGHIRCLHHRPQGSATGLLRGRYQIGRSAWYVGYSPLFLLAAAARRAVCRPFLLGSIMMVAGYVEGFLRRRPRIDDPDLISFIRRQQMRRLLLLDSQWS